MEKRRLTRLPAIVDYARSDLGKVAQVNLGYTEFMPIWVMLRLLSGPA